MINFKDAFLALYCPTPRFRAPVKHVVTIFSQNETNPMMISITLLLLAPPSPNKEKVK